MAAKFEIRSPKAAEYTWVVTSQGRTLATGATYARKALAEKAIESLRKAAAGATVADLTLKPAKLPPAKAKRTAKTAKTTKTAGQTAKATRTAKKTASSTRKTAATTTKKAAAPSEAQLPGELIGVPAGLAEPVSGTGRGRDQEAPTGFSIQGAA